MDRSSRAADAATGTVTSPWMTTVAAARYLSSTPGTLKTWRASGAGPKRYGTHRFVRYHVADLDQFMRGEEKSND
jgi:hypothetical protein